MQFFPDFDLIQVAYTLTKLMIAGALVLPIAWNRQRSARSLGLRTFPLVAVASCAFVILGTRVFGNNPESEARVIQGLITGIGFLGGGAIVKQGVSVTGTATAASIWSTAALGAAVAWGHFEVALPLAVVNFLALWGLKEVSRAVEDNNPDRADMEEPEDVRGKQQQGSDGDDDDG